MIDNLRHWTNQLLDALIHAYPSTCKLWRVLAEMDGAAFIRRICWYGSKPSSYTYKRCRLFLFRLTDADSTELVGSRDRSL